MLLQLYLASVVVNDSIIRVKLHSQGKVSKRELRAFCRILALLNVERSSLDQRIYSQLNFHLWVLYQHCQVGHGKVLLLG